MNWLKLAWRALCRVPVARYLRPLWKAALQQAVQFGGDALQAELKGLLAKKGPDAFQAINDRIDNLQERVSAWVDGLPLPAELEKGIKQFVNEHADKLQARLEAGCASGCVESANAAIDAAFDEFQESLKNRIAAL